jgi:S1-C subfamily serine protease
MSEARRPFVLFLLAFAASLLFGCAGPRASGPRGPELERILENSASTYRVDILPSGHGSGVVISHEGHILTAAHVVDDDAALNISIVEGDGPPTHYRAEVVAMDADRDLAVIKIDRRFDRVVALEDIANVHQGDAVYNVGYPYGFGEIVGRGYVMRMRYTIDRPGDDNDVRDLMLVHLPGSPGTSGSGIFAEASGKLVGIMRMMIWVSARGVPPLVIHAITPVDQIRTFLDANGIPYARDAPSGSANVADEGAPSRPYIVIPPTERR